MKRLLHVLTVPDSLVFLRDQMGFMQQRGWEVCVVTSPGPDLEAFGVREQVRTVGVEMARAITPVADARAVAQLVGLMRAWKPDLVHAHTPKGGLLGMLAAQAARVRARVYHLRGLPLMTATGARRALLTTTERVSCGIATRVICNAATLREVALDLNLAPPEKLLVLGAGSGNGVDVEGRFNPAKVKVAHRAELRSRLQIPADAFVFGFVGRLVVDKGVVDLAKAWKQVRAAHPSAWLLLVGPYEEKDAVPLDVRHALDADERVRLVGFQPEVGPWYRAMDALVFPSHREGFPNVPLEAASLELPVVASRIPGCIDAVGEDETGLFFEAGDDVGLAAAMLRYAQDPALAKRHGVAGRARTRKMFARERVWEAIAQVYEATLLKIST